MPEKAGEEKKKLSPVAVAAGAGASVTSMLIGSLFGDAGTVFGAAFSSVTYSVGAFWYEHGVRKAHAALRARRELEAASPALRLRLTPEQTQVFLRVREDAHYRRGWDARRQLRMLTAMLAVCVASAVSILLVIESATGKTLSSDLEGPAQYGTTFSHRTHPPPAAVTSPGATLPVQPSSGSPSASVTASPSPSSVPPPSLSPSPSPVITVSPGGSGGSQGSP